MRRIEAYGRETFILFVRLLEKVVRDSKADLLWLGISYFVYYPYFKCHNNYISFKCFKVGDS